MFKKRAKARIKIGQHFLGKKISATAEGYLLYEEWDQSDLKYYYWEEWELRGFNNYDSWIEFDHYSKKVKLYEPIKLKEDINALTLKKGTYIDLTVDKESLRGYVKEAGVGTTIRREGTFTYHVFPGDKVAYAEIRTRKGVITVENYNEKEKDYYKTTVLTRKKQKELLGKVVAPIDWGSIMSAGFVILFFGIMLVPSFIPQYETYCTPRSITQQTTHLQSSHPATTPAQSPVSGDEIVSQDQNQTCYRRAVYGGGGGGVGK